MAGDKIPPARLYDLIERPLEEYPSWIAPVLPKGGVLLFGGHSKIGKSFQAMEMARALASGTPLFGYHGFRVPSPTKVLYLEREIGEFGLQARAKPIFREEDPDVCRENLWYVSQDPDLSLDTTMGIRAIEAHIEQTQAQVLILDPVSHMHGQDENDNTAITKIFNNIEQIRKDFRDVGLSVIMTHHFGKPPNGRHAEDYDHLSFHNFRGASKFFSAPDTICTSHRFEEITNAGWEAWRLRMRWITRHGESPPEMVVTVNQNKDLRVRWERNINQNRVIDPTPEAAEPKKTLRPPRFAPGSFPRR